ncbi:unnamed protein product [Adineta ricciae]|uniref:Adenosine deaminase n=1 Tax=Adineta ricciae TaxID=249248 RepID=A0A815I3G5_ADIRI|nr:unnamed protein product [Adineta ricciae]CAF1362757.1 unnamed protein product [Adineta ricciae]
MRLIFIIIIIILHVELCKCKNNTEETIDYYNKLLIGDTSKLSELNMFLTAMPKGGDLHHHYSGSIYVETYLNWISKHNFCVYYENNQKLNIEKYRLETKLEGLSEEAKKNLSHC